jgi:hypothetical protein
MPRTRDYKAEYARRKAKGLARGLSVSQARGHPRAGEVFASGKASTPASTDALESALKALRRGGSLKSAAALARVSPEVLRRFVKGKGLAVFDGRAWTITDTRPRDVPMIRGDQQHKITVPDHQTASEVGRHRDAVGQALRSGDFFPLKDFEGQGVHDAQGRFHPFETDPNALYRHAAKDEPAFHEIYRIISN